MSDAPQILNARAAAASAMTPCKGGEPCPCGEGCGCGEACACADGAPC